jgi:hypothetical protein
MKKIIPILTFVIFIASSLNSFAHHYRVSNVPGASPEFTSLQAAHDASSVIAGDTLYIEPSIWSYGSFNWTKLLIIFGNGYNLSMNPETQANSLNSIIDNLSINSGADGLQIWGCQITGISFGAVSGIQIRRNYISYINFLGSGANILLLQNYINSIGSYSGAFSNVLIENNFITGLNFLHGGSVSVRNNIIANTLIVRNAVIINNIYYGATSDFQTTCSYYNNIGSANQFGTENGNLAGVNMEDVFLCYGSCSGYSQDGRYQLKPGSVAIGAGYNGADCGIFGGTYPYVLSGMPPVPAIYYLMVDQQGDLLNVDLKMKSHE